MNRVVLASVLVIRYILGSLYRYTKSIYFTSYEIKENFYRQSIKTDVSRSLIFNVGNQLQNIS